MPAPERPSVAIIIPVMDRSHDLRRSLPSLLSQDYHPYALWVVDFGSRDDLHSTAAVFGSARLRVAHRPRLDPWNHSQARNVAALYANGDLLLFLNADNEFESPSSLSRIVGAYMAASNADFSFWKRWRQMMQFQEIPPLKAALSEPPRVYSHCLGSPLLIEAGAFYRVGGYNELLEDWGYDDTDLIFRLELLGYGRVEMVGVSQRDHGEDVRLANIRNKDREFTWQRNRRISDRFIRKYGPEASFQAPRSPIGKRKGIRSCRSEHSLASFPSTGLVTPSWLWVWHCKTLASLASSRPARRLVRWFTEIGDFRPARALAAPVGRVRSVMFPARRTHGDH